jgi:hypothetical protein
MEARRMPAMSDSRPQTFTVNFKLSSPTPRAKPDDEIQALLDQANGFFQAGSRCDADFCLSPNITNSLVAPAVVCFSFAVELYLKTLLKISTVEAGRTHALSELFLLLPEETRKAAALTYQHGQPQPADQLQNDLLQVSNAFIEWRYLHERPTAQISITVVREIGKALHNTIRRLSPNSGVTFENRLALPHDWKP